jgi:hypothetical protein
VEVSRQAKAVANIAREPSNPPPHTTAIIAIGPPSISIAADTATAPPTKMPDRKEARKMMERGHIEKKVGVFITITSRYSGPPSLR